MKHIRFTAVRRCASKTLLVSLICCSWLAFVSSAIAAEPIRGESLLIWGTNDPQSPNPHHVPIDSDLEKKLSHSPYRWKYYYEVKRQGWEIPTGTAKKNIVMSSHCVLNIKNLGGDRIEVGLMGDGKPVSTNREFFKDNWPLVFAGSAGNETAWLVVIRKVKPAVKMEAPRIDQVSNQVSTN